MYAWRSIFCTVNHAAAKAVDAIIQYGVLTFRYGTLLFYKVDMQTAVLLYRYVYGLIGLTVAEFCHTVKLGCGRLCGNPVKARDFAGFRV